MANVSTLIFRGTHYNNFLFLFSCFSECLVTQFVNQASLLPVASALHVVKLTYNESEGAMCSCWQVLSSLLIFFLSMFTYNWSNPWEIQNLKYHVILIATFFFFPSGVSSPIPMPKMLYSIYFSFHSDLYFTWHQLFIQAENNVLKYFKQGPYLKLF